MLPHTYTRIALPEVTPTRMHTFDRPPVATSGM
jgi:hypothetical protein